MNPVFWLSVGALVVIFWLILSPIFKGIGDIIINKINKTRDVMFEKESSNDSEEEE